MSAPEITHLQFQTLSILMNGEKTGQAVRDELGKQGVKKSGPGFYQMMARMEDAALVRGWYEQKLIGGQAVKERCYTVTASGSRTWRHTREFYLRQFSLVGEGAVARG